MTSSPSMPPLLLISAPEQSEAGPIDGRADLYALGVIFYEILTGERAYVADSVIEVIMMHKKAPIPILPEGMEAFQELINLLMAKDRNERFRDAASLSHFIDELRRSGAVKSSAEMTAAPDFDIDGTGEDAISEPTSTRVVLEQKKKLSVGKLAMVGLLVVCGLGWGVLIVIERSMTKPEIPLQVAVTAPQPVPESGSIAPAAGVPAMSKEADPQIIDALKWLARHSLDEFRLTDPPRDNAYYYYSRLRQLLPGDPIADNGFTEIGSRFAILAERAIAQDRFDRARSYIGIGLQIDPSNNTLQLLQELTESKQATFWDALTSVFK